MRQWMSAHKAVLALLVLVTLAGTALRVDPARNPSRYQSVDERAYARLARNLARHGTYGAPEMADPVRWPPGAPAVFALMHEWRPANTNGRWDVPSAYRAQFVFSIAQIPAAFLLALVLAGPIAGLLAATAVAFYPPLIDVTGDLLTEPLGALMLLIALIAVVLALRRPTAGRAAVAGLLLGLTVLVRADLVAVPLLLAVVVGVVAWRERGRGKAAVVTAAMLAGILVPTLQWSIYAYSEAGKPVPVSSGGASNLFVGTYVPGDGSMFGLKREYADETMRKFPELRGEPYWRLPQQKVIDTVAAERPELDREAALRAAARENLREHVLGDPFGFTAMAAKKVWRLWGDYNVGTFGDRYAWITAWHLLLVAIGFAGVIAALVLKGPWRRGFVAVAVVLAYVTAVNIVLVSEARHNLPVMPVLIAGGVAGLVIAARSAIARRRLAAGGVEDRVAEPADDVAVVG